MTAIASTDITLTVVRKNRVGRCVDNVYAVAFTLATLTYPANGVPLPALSNFGVKTIDWAHFIDQDTGYVYTYDYTNHTCRIWYSAAHTHNIKIIGGLTSSANIFIDASDRMGKAAATDKTVIGSTSATTGGVVDSANAAFVELTTGATGPVCTTTHALRMRVYGH